VPSPSSKRIGVDASNPFEQSSHDMINSLLLESSEGMNDHLDRLTSTIEALTKQHSSPLDENEDDQTNEEVVQKPAAVVTLQKRAVYMRLPAREKTDSMKRIADGEQLCMCTTMGRCPLMSTVHADPCGICHSPFIERYYPSDSGWWVNRSYVDKCRDLVGVEDGITRTKI